LQEVIVGTTLVAALVLALCPAVLAGQTVTPATGSKAPPTRETTRTARTSSTGDVSGPPGGRVTQAMLDEQKDPKRIGSPAWWTTHATADGKPLSAAKR
jgi:hypothetical protein